MAVLDGRSTAAVAIALLAALVISVAGQPLDYIVNNMATDATGLGVEPQLGSGASGVDGQQSIEDAAAAAAPQGSEPLMTLDMMVLEGTLPTNVSTVPSPKVQSTPTESSDAPPSPHGLYDSLDLVPTDFTGIGYIAHENGYNVSDVLDSGACRAYSLGTLLRGSDGNSTWDQRACVERSGRFSALDGQDVDVAFLGDANVKRWTSDASDVWRWVSERVARGSIANLGCEGIDTAYGLELAWQLVEQTPISPKVWVVSLGMNDCLRGYDYADVFARLQEIVKVLRFYNCYSQVVVSAILPTSIGSEEPYSWDSNQHRTCIQYSNALMKRFVAKNANQGASYVDCGTNFLSVRGDKVDKQLMPNGLHLSHAGYIKYAACLGEHLVRFSALRPAKYAPEFNFLLDPQPLPSSKAPMYDWIYQPWSPCTAPCGSGIQTRTAVCTDSAGSTAENDMCSPSSLVLVRPCMPAPCTFHQYVVGAWGSCSEPCGTGMATRPVQCTSSTGEAVPDSLCGKLPKPSEAMECNAQPCNMKCGPGSGCSGSGQCVKSQCKCNPGYSGTWCQTAPSCASGVASRTGCCPSGLVAADGTCAPAGAKVDRFGAVCLSGNLDGCGVCNGKGDAVDVFGQCCEGGLDASGVCCDENAIDECGVCSGNPGSCAITGQMKVQASSYTDLDILMQADFKVTVSEALAEYGVPPESISVSSVTMTPGEEAAEVDFHIAPLAELGPQGVLTVEAMESIFDSNDDLRYSIIVGVRAVSRVGVCGNHICEVGEQTISGVEGLCSSDCPLSFNICPVGGPAGKACGGHGLCVPATGVCDCFPGYTGSSCGSCQGGYEKNGQACITYVGVSSTAAAAQALLALEEASKQSSGGIPLVASILVGIVCVLGAALVSVVAYHFAFVHKLKNRQSMSASYETSEKFVRSDSGDGGSSFSKQPQRARC